MHEGRIIACHTPKQAEDSLKDWNIPFAQRQAPRGKKLDPEWSHIYSKVEAWKVPLRESLRRNSRQGKRGKRPSVILPFRFIGKPLRDGHLGEEDSRTERIDGPRKTKSRRVPSSEGQHIGEIKVKSLDPPVGGRLKFFVTKWEQITLSPWILNIIKEGIKIEFLQIPYEFFVITRLNSSVQQKALEDEIRVLLAKKVLVDVPEEQEGRGFYSPLFLVSKPDGTFRTIINLKKLNSFIKNYNFKMESIRSTIKLLFPNCVRAGIDLKDAYYHLPIHNRFQKYLRVAVEVEGRIRHFQYAAMPFGLSTAPRIFTKSLGWIINIQKSRLDPQSLQTFLGFQLDSLTQRCLLPQVKITLTKQKIRAAIDRPRVSLRGAMSLLGSLNSCTPAVRWAQYHVRTLQHQILQEDKRHSGHLQSKITLSQEVLTSLGWWLDDDHLCSGVPWMQTSGYWIDYVVRPRPDIPETVISLILLLETSFRAIILALEEFAYVSYYKLNDKSLVLTVLVPPTIQECLEREYPFKWFL
ncbi:uncharacterized protein [Dendrobates tinctorius]|uniref:uncharacterized protein n=1 Tax=Dendrobates tinctorius TaxID=92724 RepID=UPI003CC9D2D7